MLPTVVFVLGAYGAYALYAVGSQRQLRRAARRERSRVLWWVRIGGWLGVALILGALVYWSPPSHDNRAKLAAALGLGGQELRGGLQGEEPLKVPAIKLPPPGQQPVYALLHPETPTMNPAPPRKPGRLGPATPGTKVKSVSYGTGKKARAMSQTAKKSKDKGAGKSRGKKKPTTGQPRDGALILVR